MRPTSRLRLEALAAAAQRGRAALERDAVLDSLVAGVLLPFLVGVAVGTSAYVSNALTDVLIDVKWRWTFALLHGGLWGVASFPVFAGFCVGLTSLSAGIALLAPAACGSGIPHVKAVLNGIRVPGTLSARTLGVKLVGITLVVASGVPAGREGPMVQVGAGVGSLALQVYHAALERGWPRRASTQLRLLDEVRGGRVRVADARAWAGSCGSGAPALRPAAAPCRAAPAPPSPAPQPRSRGGARTRARARSLRERQRATA